MLYLIKSNRMEYLVKALCATLEQVPSDPMAAEWIGIQSRGMKQWLTTSIAGTFGICANMEFLFPRQILERFSAQTDGKPVLSREIMTWAMMERLATARDWPPSLSGPGGPAGYVEDDEEGRKTWQLSRSIARVFDDYQVYRPDLLDQWAAPGAWETADRSTGEAWQAWLWQDLAKGFSPLLAGLDRLIRGQWQPGLKDGPGLPRRICLFGVSAMPPRFLDAFSALARTLDVFIFLLTPSDQFFYDLGAEGQIRKKALALELPEGFEDLETGSPLLRALGRSGREFHGILENFDYHEPFGELFEDPGQDREDGRDLSMLQVLQSDILNLVSRGPESPKVPVDPGDRSITLHACHSPMREAQVLKDLILDTLDREPDTAPHDIIVMMPDIEAYAPFLEAVFSQEPRLPYTVSDRKKRSESRTIEAFLKLVKLKASRLEKSRVMDLLLSPAIADKFDITMTDQKLIAAALSEARVFWGRDRAYREQVSGMGFEENTWAFGLSRLLLGTAMPGGESALAGSVLPCDGFEGLASDILGKFAHFTATLFKGLDSLETPKTMGGWGRCLRRFILSMMAADDGDMAFLLTALDELCQEGEAAGFDRRIGFPVMEEALMERLDQNISQGSFLAGSITFCNLMPMRSIPFKVVCLMGMDEGSFPRQSREPGFNLMARFPRLGDKQVREEDCYLFLESLLSARIQMIITYTGMSISDNSPIPCSGPVAVLRDAVAKSFEFPDRFQWIFSHPLHPFNPVYYDPDALDFFSYTGSQCNIARAQETIKAGAEVLPLFGRHLAGHDDAEPVEIRALIHFFRRPAETFVRQALGLSFPLPSEAAPDRESFRVSGLEQYSLGSSCLEDPDDPGLFSRVRASGRLPLGRKGDLEWARVKGISTPVRQLAGKMFPPGEPGSLAVSLKAGGLDFCGRVPDLLDRGRYVKTFGKLTPDRLLTQWIFHLFYCAVLPDAGETRMVGQDPKGRVPALDAGFSSMDSLTAAGLIEGLAGLYRRGRQEGLPFACVPCFHLVESLAENGFDPAPEYLDRAVKKARPFWTGSYQLKGEILDRYTAMVTGGLDPFAGADAVRSSGFLDTGLAVFRPLLEGRTP